MAFLFSFSFSFSFGRLHWPSFMGNFTYYRWSTKLRPVLQSKGGGGGGGGYATFQPIEEN